MQMSGFRYATSFASPASSAIGFLFVGVLCDCFKSRRRLEAEILVLRQSCHDHAPIRC
jgi:hypothetical protein